MVICPVGGFETDRILGQQRDFHVGSLAADSSRCKGHALVAMSFQPETMRYMVSKIIQLDWRPADNRRRRVYPSPTGGMHDAPQSTADGGFDEQGYQNRALAFAIGWRRAVKARWPRRVRRRQRRLASGGGSNAALTASDTIRFSIVIDPARGDVLQPRCGQQDHVPGRVALRSDQSTYGVGQWDKPCTLATSPVTVNARRGSTAPTTRTSTSILPFVSSRRANPAGWVMISFTDDYASWMSSSAIGYCQQRSTRGASTNRKPIRPWRP